MSSDFTISESQIDCLRELANMGAGKATTSLSLLLDDEKVLMDVPEVVVVPLKEVTDYIEAEKHVAAVFFEVKSDCLDMMILFILNYESAEKIVKKVLGNDAGLEEKIGRSTLLEVGNIVNTSYFNALSEVTGTTLVPGRPGIAFDMGGAILGTVFSETMMVDDYLILSLTDITTENDNLKGKIFVFPYQGSLQRLCDSMGV